MVAFDGRVRRADVRGTCRKSASADPLREGIRAFLAHDYVTAARIFTDLAPHGNPVAQTYLGYMYANGKGVPQDFTVSAGWYSCASEQGVAEAQYELGLMYDKALGVPQDYVAAYALVNLASQRLARSARHGPGYAMPLLSN